MKQKYSSGCDELEREVERVREGRRRVVGFIAALNNQRIGSSFQNSPEKRVFLVRIIHINLLNTVYRAQKEATALVQTDIRDW